MLCHIFLIIILAAFNSGRPLNLPIESLTNVWEESGQFEGDIKLSATQQRNGLIYPAYRWRNRILPYVISPYFSRADRFTIERAIAEYTHKTCIYMRKYNPIIDRDYVYIKNDGMGCWSRIGRAGGRQYINLNCVQGCCVRGVILHEILHSLGFFHQQSSTNRDDYVTINWANIVPGLTSNFAKYSANQITSFGVPYDYSSIMHYSKYAFSKNGKPTIIPKNPTVRIGQRTGFSAGDLEKLGKMYNCASNW